MNEMHTDEALAQLLERGLMQQYGPLISNDDLRQALGYPSNEAFRQALVRKRVPVPVFDFENRRGKYALTVDVASWLVAQRKRAFTQCAEATAEVSASTLDKEGGPMD